MKVLERDEWVSCIDCHLCKKNTPTKETYTIELKKIFFGVEGFCNVKICKECHREEKLTNLFKSEKQE
jgi:formate-dependent nitrite reductase cytochrome c552 subunit